MASDRARAALDDLAAIDQQRAAGLVDDATARRLWVRYAREALDADGDAATARSPVAQHGTDVPAIDGEPHPRRPRRRSAAMAVVVAVAISVATLSTNIGDRAPGDFVTGSEATGSSTDGRDLGQVTNAEMEEVVAANPDVVPMRLRLAHRYLDGGELDSAVEHYLAVLDREDDAEAMSHLGWIMFTQGRGDLAASLIDRSLELSPGDVEATWFRANVLLYAQAQPAEAVPLLEDLLTREEIGEGQRADVEAALGDALEALDQQGAP